MTLKAVFSVPRIPLRLLISNAEVGHSGLNGIFECDLQFLTSPDLITSK